MSNVGYATLNVIPTAKGFASDLGKQLGGDFDSVGSSGGKRMGGALMPAFGALVGPAMAAAGVAAIGSFVAGTISAAGDLEQSTGAVVAVFQQASPAMESFAKSAASSYGLAANEVNELSTILGTQLKNAGVSMDDLAPKTQGLIGVGADLSAMFGGTTREAVEALSSALKGERDPIERYGVSLNQAAIDAEAARLGFEKVGGTLSAEANSAATLSLIMAQTADAHGAAAREAGSLQSQQQRLSAGWVNLQAAIGGAFLPMASAAVGVLADLVGGAMPFLQTVGPGLSSIFSAVGPAFGELGQAVVQLLPAISPLGVVFKGLMPVLPQIAALVAQLATIIAGNLTVVTQALTPVVAVLADVMSRVLAAALPVVTTLLSALAPVLGIAAELFATIVSAIAPLIVQIADLLIPIIEALLPVVQIVFTFVADIVKVALGVIQGVISVVTSAIAGDWDGVWAGIQGIFVNAWNGILGALGNALGGLQTWFTGLLPSILNWLGDVGSWLYSIGSDLIRGLLGGIGAMASNIWDSIVGPISDAVDGVRDLLGIHSPSRLFRDVGTYIGEGLVGGIAGMAGEVEGAASGLATSAISGFGNPSLDVDGGLMGGINATRAAVQASGEANGQPVPPITINSNDPNLVGAVVADKLRRR